MIRIIGTLILVIFFQNLQGQITINMDSLWKIRLTCDAKIYDPGGEFGSSAAGEDVQLVVCPDQEGATLELYFDYFDLWTIDTLIIFDGIEFASDLLGQTNGKAQVPGSPFYGWSDSYSIPSTVTAGSSGSLDADGCLTLWFKSELSGSNFIATASCATSCPDITASLSLEEPFNFIDDTLYICSDDIVPFVGDAVYTADGSSGAFEYYWNFGDGSPEIQQSQPEYSYDSSGIYYMQMWAQDGNCASNVVRKIIKVSSGQGITFDDLNTPDTICIQDTVAIDATSKAAGELVIVEIPTPSSEEEWLPEATTTVTKTIDYSAVFPPGAKVTSADDIKSIFVGLEHSYMGLISLEVECPEPSNASVILHNSSGSGIVNNTYPEYADYAHINFGDVNVEESIVDGVLNGINLVGIAYVGRGINYEFLDPNSSTLLTALQAADADQVIEPVVYPSSVMRRLEDSTFTAEEPFSQFIGCPLGGEWKINITTYDENNHLGGNIPVDGFLFGFSVNFDSSLYILSEEFQPEIVSMTWECEDGMEIISQDSLGLAQVSPTNAETDYTCTLTAFDDVGCSNSTQVIINGKNCIDCTAPTVFNGVINACDEGNGNGIYDLLSAENDVNPFSPELSVIFYEDEELSISITDPSAYISGPKIVYVLVGDGGVCSATATISLTLGSISLNPLSETACALPNSNLASFDLTQLDSVLIGNQTGVSTQWFFDEAHTNPVTGDLSDFQTQLDTLYVLANDNSNCSASTTVELIAGPIEANETSITECIAPNSSSYEFDLTQVESEINNQVDITFNYFTDENLTNAIIDPSSYIAEDGDSVFVQVLKSQNCFNTSVINLNLTKAPIVYNGVYSLCAVDEGVSVDLESLREDISPSNVNLNFQWCEDEDCNNPIADPTDYIVTQQIIVYAHVGDNCTSTATVSFILDNGTAASITLTACDEGNGFGLFDLEGAQASINGSDDASFKWYTDAATTNQIITDLNNYSSQATSLYCIVAEGSCSTTVEIPLTLGQVEANDVTIRECGDTEGTFNLAAVEFEIGGGNPVTFYTDSTKSVSITNIESYTSAEGEIYASIGNGTCESGAKVTLDIIPIPVAANATITKVELFRDSAFFDLTTVEDAVRNGSTGTVRFFYDTDMTLELTGINASNFPSGDGSVVALLNNQGCEDTSTVFLIVENDSSILRRPDTAVLISCNSGGGEATFDLTSLDEQMHKGTFNTVNWYTDIAATRPINNPSAYTTGDSRVYCTVNTFSGVGYVDLYVVNPDQVAQTFNYEQCDNGNGTATFDLSKIESIVNRNSDYAVVWYTDAEGSNEIDQNQIESFTTSTTVIYATLELPEGACSNIIPVPINLFVVDQIKARSGFMSICGDSSLTGDFNLTLLQDYLTYGIDYEVKWYEDQSLTALISNPKSYTSASATIYASYSASASCSVISEVVLQVGELVIRPTRIVTCKEEGGEGIFNLIKSESYISYGVEHNALWYENAKLDFLIGTPGNYSSESKTVWIDVTVANDSTCSKNAAIELEVRDLKPKDTSMTYCDNNVEGKSFNLRDLDAIMTQNTNLEVAWYKTANRINSINNPSYYIPEQYTDGVHTVYAEVCGNVASVNLIVFEKDSFKIDLPSDEYLIDLGDSILLTTSGDVFNHLWSPAQGLSDTNRQSVMASPSQTTFYEVNIFNDAGCSTTDTIAVYVQTQEDQFDKVIADVFSPDGNGENDVLYVQGPGLCAVDLKIYNRWGVIVYESTNPNQGWNGGLNNDINNPVPAGDYRYTLSVKHCGQTDQWDVKEPGVVTIIK